MVYLGSKRRIVKHLLPILLRDRKADQWFVEPFCGGCNITEHITGNVIANDNNPYLIALYHALQNGWLPPEMITEELYHDVKDHKESHHPALVGWAGFAASFGAKWFAGFTGKKKDSTRKIDDKYWGRDRSNEAYHSLLKQIPKIKHVHFTCSGYQSLQIPNDSIIYCDAPYINATKYKNNFDHSEYYEWLRLMSKEHTVYISERTMPDDFECIVEIPLTINLQGDSVKTVTERLFKLSDS
jgi:DNA adenine methylase